MRRGEAGGWGGRGGVRGEVLESVQVRTGTVGSKFRAFIAYVIYRLLLNKVNQAYVIFTDSAETTVFSPCFCFLFTRF